MSTAAAGASCLPRSITAGARLASSYAPSSLGCSADTVRSLFGRLEPRGLLARLADRGALLVWMNDQDVAARLARHRLTDALTE